MSGLARARGDEAAVALAAPAGAAGARAGTAADEAARSWRAAFVADLAPQDWLIGAYFALLFVGVLFGAGPDRPLAGRVVLVHAAVLAAGLALTRGGILRRGSFANALCYRLTVFSTVLSSYFALRLILPAAAPRVVDATLYAIDLHVFHYEPAVAWDPLATPPVVEWFSFFYFGYFFLLALHVLPFMFLGKNLAILARFSTAIFFTFCCGHLLYIVVPGFGPHEFLAASFTHPLEGGRFWHMVQATVADAGAQKDIFPSLHTAVPSMFTMLAWKHRKEFFWFRISAPLMTFCTSQIIVATMLLRWHYLIDICAGLTLAAIAVRVADWSVVWDDARRARQGLTPAWRSLFRQS